MMPCSEHHAVTDPHGASSVDGKPDRDIARNVLRYQAFSMPVCHAGQSRMVPREVPSPQPAEVPLNPYDGAVTEGLRQRISENCQRLLLGYQRA